MRRSVGLMMAIRPHDRSAKMIHGVVNAMKHKRLDPIVGLHLTARGPREPCREYPSLSTV
jgi:hypothetical protein